MSEIHKTTLVPSKLELVSGWLPRQPWYVGGVPQLSKAGGFRLDDPAGAVGIEFMVVADAQGDDIRYYQVILSYRGSPLTGSDQALLGTSEHGVLGTRWFYDGADDPVVLAQLFDLVQGEAAPQAQSDSDTPDPTVIGRWNFPHQLRLVFAGTSASDNAETAVPMETEVADDAAPQAVTLHIVRELHADGETANGEPPVGLGYVSAVWTTVDGIQLRGTFARITGAD